MALPKALTMKPCGQSILAGRSFTSGLASRMLAICSANFEMKKPTADIRQSASIEAIEQKIKALREKRGIWTGEVMDEATKKWIALCVILDWKRKGMTDA